MVCPKICSETLMCWSPNRVGAFYAGPALEGTKCGEGGRHCIEGECRDRIQRNAALDCEAEPFISKFLGQ